MRYVWDDEYTVRLLDGLPPSVPAFVSESPDGHYNIYINARLNGIQQREALDHELRHIARGDLDSGRYIYEIEDYTPRLPTHNPLGIPGVIMASDLAHRHQLRAVQVTPEPDPQPRRPVVRPIHPVPPIPTYTSWPPSPDQLTREQYTLIYGTPEQIRQYFYNRTIENRMVAGL